MEITKIMLLDEKSYIALNCVMFIFGIFKNIQFSKLLNFHNSNVKPRKQIQ